MSLLPLPKGIGDVDVKATVDEFLTVLRSIEAKLDTLIEMQSEYVEDEIIEQPSHLTELFGPVIDLPTIAEAIDPATGVPWGEQ